MPVAGDLAVLEVDGEADLGERLQELVVVALQLGLVGLLLVVPLLWEEKRTFKGFRRACSYF